MLGQTSSYPWKDQMLARRMLTFVAVLLALTALAAAFAPPPPRTTGAIDTSPSPAPSTGRSETVSEKLDAGAEKRRTITVQQGDILRLEVTGEDLDVVELQGLGAIKALGPGAVASFDVLASEPGDYPVVLENDDRTIAVVRITPPQREGLAPVESLTRRTRDT